MFKILPICLFLVAISTLTFSEITAWNSILFRKLHPRFDKPTDHARVARELVHKSQWAPFGTNSILKSVKGFPMVNIISIADSPAGGQSTGVIYFYLTGLDFTGQDLKKDNKATLLFTDDIDSSCSKQSVDPMEPTCARAIISGSVQQIEENSKEYEFGKNAFISRHPAATNWLKAHNFYLCKLVISKIFVLDWYGGPHDITPKEYYDVVL